MVEKYFNLKHLLMFINEISNGLNFLFRFLEVGCCWFTNFSVKIVVHSPKVANIQTKKSILTVRHFWQYFFT